MVTLLVLFQLFIVLALIFIGARVGGIGLGIYGMVGVFILVFIFGTHPGKVPIDVMLIIASVITATAALQAAGGLDYLVGLAAKFLRKHPTHITYWSADHLAFLPCGWYGPHLLLTASDYLGDCEEFENPS